MNKAIDELKAVWKTFIGKVIIIIATAASGSLGYVTDVFTEWSAGAVTQIESIGKPTE